MRASDGSINYVKLRLSGSSLRAMVASGKQQLASSSRSDWLSLTSGFKGLQPHCNRVGINPSGGQYLRLRLGILGNNENNCNSCDSFVGVGYDTSVTVHKSSVTAGWG